MEKKTQFTYSAYEKLLTLLKDKNYHFADYHNYDEHSKCVIVRHDVDNSLSQALKIAELEAKNNIKSTYFVMLRTEFYNVAAYKSQLVLKRIHDLGHEIGLHFDEVAYGDEEKHDIPKLITNEAYILSRICNFPITTVSMHRPSKETLSANYVIPGIVNSYGTELFQGFKYVSDSRRRWREPVLDIISSEEYNKLHILTHPFWYHEEDVSITDTIMSFINQASEDRLKTMRDNISNFDELLICMK